MNDFQKFIKIALIEQYINTLEFDVSHDQVGYNQLQDEFKRQNFTHEESINQMKSIIKYHRFYINSLLNDQTKESLYKNFIIKDEMWDDFLDLDGELYESTNFINFQDNKKLFKSCEEKITNYYLETFLKQ